ncbi:PUA-like domain-containing protein [Lasiosphaeria hispida]|uniref:PUA-like domain-containing protein n=1 Tax=Lasiosphaeria hispida TaxID=260671 RepID=A0AAJ0HD46_9PEZI|nr:PUA-like domain-containing protein [Lasiosphaeria hispida]
MSSNLGAAPATTLSPDAVLIPGSGSAPDSAHSLGATSGGGAAPSGAPNGDEQPADNETDVASIWDGSLEEGRRQITTLITKTKRFHGSDQAPSVVAELDRRARSVRAFLFYLEHTATISPTVKEKIHAALNLFKTGDNRTAHVPRGIIDKAVELFDRFEDENWGEDEPDEPEDDTSLAVAATPAAPAAAPARPGIVTNTVETRLPPRNHPIWGINGIMHGVTRYVKKNGGIGYTLDSRYAKRPFDVFGHNGLVPGYWWPTQLVTLFHGAHGHQVRGISGSKDHGAYSIVISGRSIYGDMDEDTGDEVWYSADNSRKNTSRNSLPADSNGSQSLRISLATGSPVRVLRSAGHGAGAAHHWAPSVGYRYDGLYTVVRVRQATNDNGGLYAQFLLRRVQGQPGPGLAVLRQTIPNNQQKADFGRINAGY